MKTGKETPIRLVNGGQLSIAEVDFIRLCEMYAITPTKRQLSKFRNNKGRLYNAIHKSKA